MVSDKSANGSKIWSAAILVVALLGTSWGAVAAPAQPADEGLFSEVAADGSPVGGQDAVDDPTVVRSRLVTVDLAQMGVPDDSMAERLVLNFFPDAVVTAVLDRVERNPSGSLSWIGHLEEVELSEVTLVVKDGVMMGNAVAPGLFYQMRYVGEGVHAVREVDQAAFPPEAQPIPVEPPEGAWDQPIDGATADDGSTIDVLVVYTDDVLAYYGGNTTSVENMIDLAVSETNEGYGHSGITQRVNLVHTEMISYNETGFDWNQTLSRFAFHGDGYFDAVTEPSTGLRDTYLADESVLIVMNGGYCGIAYLMSPVGSYFAGSAFAVVSRGCATGYYSFGHEMGHNMGAHHDRANASGSGAYSYSYGYQAPNEAFRTVMAYDCSSPGCPRVNYWSNPDVWYGGQPTGVTYTAPNSADNHLTLNNTAYTVANFRVSNHPPNVPASPSPADGATGQSASPDLGWTGGDPDAGDTVTYDVYLEAGDATPDNIACGDTTATTCDPGALTRGAHYYWRVVATDNHGESADGPVWDFYVNQLPDAPTGPMPPDGATGESRDTDLSWTGGDPDAGDTVTYTIYLDTSTTPTTQRCQSTSTTCDPGSTLAANTHYYWQVVATDNHSESTPGPVWDFTTGTATGPTIRGYVRDGLLTALEGVTVTFSGPLTTTTGSDGYYTQAGFGSGTVTVTVAADGYTFSPWLDQMTLGGDVTHNVTGYPLVHTPLLFSDGFEGGSLSSAWAVETDYEGRVEVSSPYHHQGSYSLLLDDEVGPGDFTSHASAILPLDLSGETEVKLSFWWRAFYFENPLTDQGVFISDDDGLTWSKVATFTYSSAFSHTTIDLDARADDAGMSLNDHFLVKFQIYEDYPAPSDGCAIDDVVVYSDRYNTHLPLILRE